jgi:hypothetical protein
LQALVGLLFVVGALLSAFGGLLVVLRCRLGAPVAILLRLVGGLVVLAGFVTSHSSVPASMDRLSTRVSRWNVTFLVMFRYSYPFE